MGKSFRKLSVTYNDCNPRFSFIMRFIPLSVYFRSINLREVRSCTNWHTWMEKRNH